MALVDTAFLQPLQNYRPVDYIGLFTRGYNVANSLPWSAENIRKRQIEDYALAMRQQQFAAQMAEHAQQMKLREALLPYQIARYKQLASGGAQNQVGSDPLSGYIDAIRSRQQGVEAPPVADAPTEVPDFTPEIPDAPAL